MLDFAGANPDSPWLVALAWAKGVFAKTQRLSQRTLAEYPEATLPKRLRQYLLSFDADGQPSGLHADRYEFWLYRQIRKRLKSGELYLDDSLQHRCFSDELVSLDAKADVLSQMDIPWLRRPIETQLNALATELRAQWLAFDRELRQATGRLEGGLRFITAVATADARPGDLPQVIARVINRQRRAADRQHVRR